MGIFIANATSFDLTDSNVLRYAPFMASNKETASRIRPSLSTPTASDARAATELVAYYRENGIGSNRMDWSRLPVLLACFFCAERGHAVALPYIEGNSPVYNRAWRAMRSALSQEQWERVTVCAVNNGRFTTTATVGIAYLVPEGTPTKGEAPKGW
jgi:hypothetical protein